MLVISRRLQERIRISDNIWITIIDVGGSYDHPKVKLGIEAPREIQVTREELLPEEERPPHIGE